MDQIENSCGLMETLYTGYIRFVADDDLNRKIRGDWFEARESYDEIYKLEDVFAFDLTELNTIVSDLRTSVEEGVTEYKQHKLSQLYLYLESLQFDSRGFDDLGKNARDFAHLLYVVLIQRLIASGAVPIRSGEQNDAPDEDTDKMGMKEILEEIQQRLPEQPELKQHAAVKNIFMQVNIYKRELANMQKLLPNILPEKRESFLANFKQTFAGITEKIREQYRQIQREDETVAASEIAPTNPLRKHDIKPLAKIFEDQGKEFSVVRSTLQYAADERYKTRDILTNIIERKDRLGLLISAEQDRYAGMEPGPGGMRIMSRTFGAELITVLQRQITRIS